MYRLATLATVGLEQDIRGQLQAASQTTAGSSAYRIDDLGRSDDPSQTDTVCNGYVVLIAYIRSFSSFLSPVCCTPLACWGLITQIDPLMLLAGLDRGGWTSQSSKNSIKPNYFPAITQSSLNASLKFDGPRVRNSRDSS